MKDSEEKYWDEPESEEESGSESGEEQQKKENQQEMRKLFLLIQGKRNIEAQIVTIVGVNTAANVLMKDMEDVFREEQERLSQLYQDDNEELACDTPKQRMELESEYTGLKEADQQMAVDYEHVMGEREESMVECAECIGLPGDKIRARMAEEERKKNPNQERLGIYRDLLAAGADGKKKQQVFERVKTKRDEALKEFFLESGKTVVSEEGVQTRPVSRLEAAAQRNVRENKLKRALKLQKPISMSELMEQEDRSVAPKLSKAPDAPGKTMGKELSMTRKMPPKKDSH